MNKRICFYSPPFPRIKSYRDMADISSEYGFDSFEGFTALDFAIPDIEAAKKLKNYIDEKGLKICCFSAYINLVGDDRKEQAERLKGYAEVAAILGSPYLHHTIVNNFMDPASVMPYKNEFFKRGIEAVREIYDYCEALGVRTIYEDQGFIFNGVEGFGNFLSEVNRNVGVVADFGNVYQAGNTIEEFITAFSDKIVHVHIKDVRMDNNPERGYKTLIDGTYMHATEVGVGDVNIRDGVELLEKSGYTGYYTLEYSAPDDNSPVIDETLKFIDTLI